MSEQMPEERRKRKGRSPSYPGIALGDAIEKAAVLYKKESRHAAHMDDITDHWGYKPKTGPGLVAIAALKKFGLLEEVEGNGSRRARLTELALSILLHDEDSPARQRWVREAALMPAIHQELWKQFDGRLPSDQNLRRTLVLQRGFTESGAHQFIRQFKSTIGFARLAPPDKMPEAQPPQHRPSGEHAVSRSPDVDAAIAALSGEPAPLSDTGKRPDIRTIQLPVSMRIWPELRVPYPMTKQAWDEMLFLIKAAESGVVEATVAPDVAPDPVQSSERSEGAELE